MFMPHCSSSLLQLGKPNPARSPLSQMVVNLSVGHLQTSEVKNIVANPGNVLLLHSYVYLATTLTSSTTLLRMNSDRGGDHVIVFLSARMKGLH